MTAGPTGARLQLGALRRVQTLCLVGLIYAGLCAAICEGALELNDPFDLIDLFSLSEETNIPTWFASAQLLICSVAIAWVALATRQAQGRYVAHWWGLAAAFLYISIDETVQIHEEMNHWFDTGGVLYFGWVIPASVIVAVFGLSYLGFLAHLPKETRNRFICAGAIFVGGAIGVELVLGYWTDLEGDQNLVYGLIDWVEESMELCGIGLMLHSVVAYLAGSGGFVFQLESEREREEGSVEPKATDAAVQPAAARRSFGTMVAVWAGCLVLGGAIVATGQSKQFRYENSIGFHLDRPSYLGEDLSSEMRGGQRFSYVGEVRIFDTRSAARTLLLIAIGGFAVLWSASRLNER